MMVRKQRPFRWFLRERLPLQASGAAIGLAMGASVAAAGELALKRAVLGLGGVGYFEYEAQTDGVAPVTLRAKLEQIDDILKSLIVSDAAGPALISLPGKAGVSATFNALPFAQEDLADPVALLSALRGASIAIAGPRKLEGRIISVNSETIADKDGRSRLSTRVTLLAGGALESFLLEEAQGISFADARTGRELAAALDAVQAARDKSGRDIAIRFTSGAMRAVRVGYVVEAPVWKTTYRLSLPLNESEMARLQGWAVLENQTGSDWNAIALTLTAGAPSSIRQALYESYFVQRPVVEPPVPNLALPRIDDGARAVLEVAARAMPMSAQGNSEGAGAERQASDSVAEDGAAPVAKRTRAMPPAAPLAVANGGTALWQAAPSRNAQALEAMSSASFTISAPVSAKAGESLSMPFLDSETPAKAIAWVQAERAAHPLARGDAGSGRKNSSPRPDGALRKYPWRAATIKNATSAALPAGSAILYVMTPQGPLFAGEAQAPAIPAGQERMLAFGLDQGVSVTATSSGSGVLSQVSLSRGMIVASRRIRETTSYQVQNEDGQARRLVIDHPRLEHETLVAPKAAAVEATKDVWRLTRELPPGQTLVIAVTVERNLSETVAADWRSGVAGLASALGVPQAGEGLTPSAFATALQGMGFDVAARERFATIAGAMAALSEKGVAIGRVESERADIFKDQERLRANYAAVGGQSDLARDIVQKLKAQEDRLAGLEKTRATLRAEQESAQRQLDEAIGKSGAGATFTLAPRP